MPKNLSKIQRYLTKRLDGTFYSCKPSDLPQSEFYFYENVNVPHLWSSGP